MVNRVRAGQQITRGCFLSEFSPYGHRREMVEEEEGECQERASERENEREKPCTAYTEGVEDEMRRMAMGGNG